MSGLHEVLVVDQAPIFDEAREAFHRAYALVRELKGELHRHETADVPAYGRWFNATFGALITENRELVTVLGELERKLAPVRQRHWQRFFGNAGGHYYECEQEEFVARGMSAFWQSVEVEAEFEDDGEESPYGPEHEERRYQQAGGAYDDEDEGHYNEDAESAGRFEDLFDTSRGEPGRRSWNGASGKGGSGTGGAGTKNRKANKAGAAAEAAAEAAARESETLTSEELRGFRLKDLYRGLVRRLHPDHNPQLSTEEKRLWNEVQAAYKEKNLAQLELLLALANVLGGSLVAGAGLYDIRRSLREIESLVPALRDKVAAARKSRAWRFSERADLDRLRAEVERELRAELAQLRTRITAVETQIARFSAGFEAEDG